MKLLCQILLWAILLCGIAFFVSRSVAESMGFEQAHQSGVLTAYEMSYLVGPVLSVVAVSVALYELVSCHRRKRSVLYPILAGVTGIAFVLCLFVLPIVRVLDERVDAEAAMTANDGDVTAAPAAGVEE